MNNVEKTSGIGTQSPNSFSSSYCTFLNNKVSDRFCLWVIGSTGTISYVTLFITIALMMELYMNLVKDHGGCFIVFLK